MSFTQLRRAFSLLDKKIPGRSNLTRSHWCVKYIRTSAKWSTKKNLEFQAAKILNFRKKFSKPKIEKKCYFFLNFDFFFILCWQMMVKTDWCQGHVIVNIHKYLQNSYTLKYQRHVAENPIWTRFLMSPTFVPARVFYNHCENLVGG